MVRPSGIECTQAALHRCDEDLQPLQFTAFSLRAQLFSNQQNAVKEFWKLAKNSKLNYKPMGIPILLSIIGHY